MYCIPLFELNFGAVIHPSFSHQPPTQKTANGAPTWKASTLNLQCFDHTTAAQLFHHQLAFHVASGWLDPGNKRLKLPPPEMYLLSKMGGNMPLALGITFRNWEFPTPPPKRVGKIPAFSRYTYELINQTKPTNKISPANEQLASEKIMIGRRSFRFGMVPFHGTS